MGTAVAAVKPTVPISATTSCSTPTNDMQMGLHVGWAKLRRSCGIAVLGAKLDDEWGALGDVRARGVLTSEVAGVLRPIIARALDAGERVLVVVDGIVDRVAHEPEARGLARGLDGLNTAGAFARRVRIPPVNGLEGRQSAMALHGILQELALLYTMWLGDGDMPESGLVIVETCPSVSMAVALPMVDPEVLPTRARPRRLHDGRLLRSKVAWYWEAGAAHIAAGVLGADVTGLKGQTSVGALWSLALARQLEQGDASAIGDEIGICVLGTIDPSWASEVEGIGVRWGRVAKRSGPMRPVVAEPIEVVTDMEHRGARAHDDDRDDDPRRGDTVTVYLTERDALSADENPWVTTVLFPCRLHWEDREGPLEIRRMAGTERYVLVRAGTRVTDREVKSGLGHRNADTRPVVADLPLIDEERARAIATLLEPPWSPLSDRTDERFWPRREA